MKLQKEGKGSLDIQIYEIFELLLLLFAMEFVICRGIGWAKPLWVLMGMCKHHINWILLLQITKVDLHYIGSKLQMNHSRYQFDNGNL